MTTDKRGVSASRTTSGFALLPQELVDPWGHFFVSDVFASVKRWQALFHRLYKFLFMLEKRIDGLANNILSIPSGTLGDVSQLRLLLLR
jgi:hypothetical protein